MELLRIPASRDTAPQAAVEGLDFDKIKEDFGLLGASLNAPKIYMPVDHSPFGLI